MKKIIVLLLALLLTMFLAACGTVEKTQEIMENVAVEGELTVEEVTEEATEEAEELSAYPVTIVDQAGREVVIEEYPETLVSGYYISSSALIALGQTDKFVGIEAKADKRPIYSFAAPELIELPSVGSAKEFDLEGCIALEPDLVILPQKLKDAAATMEEMGMDVLLVNPENGELLTEMIWMLGAALDCSVRAEELVTAMNGIETEIAAAVASEEAPTVYLAGNSSFLSTAPNGMYQSDLIAMAGGINVAAEVEDTYWVDVSYEQVLAWDPEYIILASDASYGIEDVYNDAALAGCTAVAEGRVYQMPSDIEAWDSPVPGGILGAAWIANILHPEAVTVEHFAQFSTDFYETFYGLVYES